MHYAELANTNDGYLSVSMHVYPHTTLSDAMCKLSVDGKAHTVPTGLKPQLPWMWRFEQRFAEAITKLLVKHEIEIKS